MAESREWLWGIRAVAAVTGVLAPCSSLWAHGDDAEGLGHHWESAAYLGEVKLQLVVMAVMTCAIVGWMLAVRYLGRRGMHR